MKLKGISKKIVAYMCALALAVTSFAVPTVFAADTDELPDLILDGGEEGASTMMGHFDPPTSRGKPSDVYKYLGWASLLDGVPDKTFDEGNYRYLVMTYTGDITQFRIEFTRKGEIGDGSDDEKEGPYWFNPEGQTYYFVTADGSDIPLIGDNTTIVIDLAKSVNPNALDGSGIGVGIDWYNSGLHLHCDEMVKHGNGEGITISNAYLTTTAPVIEEETTPEETTIEEITTPEEITTEEITTPEETTTEEITTEEPTTEEPTTEEPTTEVKTDPIVLDGDEDGASSLIGSYDSGTDGYAYLGYVYLKEATANYKYLKLTYTGSLEGIRLENDGVVYWFNQDQASHFVTVDGTPAIKLNAAKPRTVVIDLEKSGLELGWDGGMHIHSEGMATNGGFTISDATLYVECPEVPVPVEYTVTVDGTEVATVEEGDTYTLPTTANVGYYVDGALYAPGAELTVNGDVAATSVNITAAMGASIRMTTPAGIRFRASIEAADEVFDNVITGEGMLIAPADLYADNGNELAIDSDYTKVNVVNNGWYNNTVGTYCGSLVGIGAANYGRNFVAKAYVTVQYADGTTATVYSNTTATKSVRGIATAIQASDEYNNLSVAQKTLIDTFATVK